MQIFGKIISDSCKMDSKNRAWYKFEQSFIDK